MFVQGLAHRLDTANTARDQLARPVQQLGASPVAGPPGSRGEPSPTATGPAGPPGARGEQGSPGANASPVPGPTGATGPPGADSTIPGPQGSPGTAGQDGKDGTNGKDGAAGQPPAGWKYTDPAGITYICSRVDDFDPSDPRYTCSPSTPSSPTPTPASGLPALFDRRRT